MSLGLVLRTLTDHPRNEFKINNAGSSFILYQRHGFGFLSNWEEVNTFPNLDEAIEEMTKLVKEHKD
jgi:hypothetical protein